MRKDIKTFNIANVINITFIIVGLSIGLLAQVGLMNLTLFLIGTTTNAIIIEKRKNITKNLDEKAVVQNA